MKRLLPAAASTAIAFGAMAGVAAAQSQAGCTLIDTGPNSNNSCEIVNENELKISCKNDIDVVFVNNQSSESGSVTLEENTNGGYAYSGNAVNTNDATGNLDVSCAPAKVVTPPPSEDQGEKKVAQVAQPVVKAAVLPPTGANPVAAIGIVALVLGAIAGVAQFGSKAYKLFRS